MIAVSGNGSSSSGALGDQRLSLPQSGACMAIKVREAHKVRETRNEHIDMDGRRQFGLGRRGQLEPGWRTGRRLGRHNSHWSAGAGRLGFDRDGEFDHRFVLSLLRVGGNEHGRNSLDNTGHLRVDANGGEGGTILNVGGALTDSGTSASATPRSRRRTR
jgi:hypothetical protein